MSHGQTSQSGYDIAIIGMSCRLPGADSIGEFWANLCAGIESITTFSAEDLAASGVPQALIDNPAYVRAAPALNNVDSFDAAFFGYAPKEATLIEPQQRLFLEVAWETMESAGYCPDQNHEGPIGVYCGGGSVVTSYMLANASNPALHGQTAGLEHISNDNDFMATRVSYKLNLSGPGLTVQTACSTSLVAVHLACQGILTGDCEMALAGASAIRIPHVAGYLAEKGNVHSSDGHCRPFDADGTGTIFGSGVVAVLLKPLQRAIADQDQIYAVIKGSAINNDGNAKISYTAPSTDGQAAAMRRALSVAGVRPDSIGYVECHATGTTVGDPLEVSALTRAFRSQTDAIGFCGLGSVKSNIGHPEQAAGLAGLVKTALALKNEYIPATVHLNRVNPEIGFDGSPFYPIREGRPWTRGDSVRRAGVNSLGIGGTNAFVILEEPPATDDVRYIERPRLLGLSARSPTALQRRAADLASAMTGENPVAELVHTANRSSTQMRYRSSVVGVTAADFSRRLRDVGTMAGSSRADISGNERVVFLFSGQGAQYAGMGRLLHAQEPTFATHFDDVASRVSELIGEPLKDICFDPDSDRINATRYAQLCLFAFEYALARTWESWGVQPDAVIGHSLGELTAACIAGCMSLEQAVLLVERRSRLMQSAPAGGRMLAVADSADALVPLIAPFEGQLSIASFNAERSTVISGTAAAVDRLSEALDERGIRATPLVVSHAFHSPMMEPVLEEFELEIQGMEANAPHLPFVSNVTGALHDSAPTPAYWRRQIREPVRFADGIETLRSLEFNRFIEIGPGSTLTTLARLNGVSGGEFVSVASCDPRRDPDELCSMLMAAGTLYENGAQLSWESVNGGSARKVALPTYPFERRRFWVSTPDSAKQLSGDAGLPTNGAPVQAPPAQTPSASQRIEPMRANGASQTAAPSPQPAQWSSASSVVRAEDFSLSDHLVADLPVIPTMAFVALLTEQSTQAAEADVVELRDFVYQNPLVLPDAAAAELTFEFEPGDRGAGFRVASRVGRVAGEVTHVTGHVSTGGRFRHDQADVSVLVPNRPPDYESDRLYTDLVKHGIHYGPAYRNLSSLWLSGAEASSQFRQTDGHRRDSRVVNLDAALHGYVPLLGPAERVGSILLPVRFSVMRLRTRPTALAYASLTRTDSDGGRHWCDVVAYDAAGAVVMEIEGLEIRELDPSSFLRSLAHTTADWLYQVVWQATDVSPHEVAAVSGRWAIVGHDEGALSGIRAQLEGRGASCSMHCTTGQHWPFDPLRETLKEALTAEPATKLLILCEMGDSDPTPDSANDLDSACETTLGSALAAIQSLQTLQTPEVVFATVGCQRVTSESGVENPVGAIAWGFAQTLAQEHPALRPRCIDLDPERPFDEQIEALLAEAALATTEGHVGYRGGRRFVSRLVRLPLPEAREEISLKPDATYVITGGLGNLGLKMADRMARYMGARSLVLTTRSGASEEQQARIREMERAGCNVRVLTAVTTTRKGIKRLLADISDLPPLRGIVHCAGTLQDRIIANLDWTAFKQSFEPKVRSAWLLHQLTRDEQLDFFVLQSSVLSVVGSAGQSNYTAANAFLDALAHYRRSHGLPGSVMNWGPWSGGGMASSSGERGEAIWRTRGISYIDPNTGTGLFETLLEADVPQAIISKIDWQRHLAGRPEVGLYEAFHGVEADEMPSPHADRKRDATAVPEAAGPVDGGLLEQVHAEVAAELGFEEAIDLDQPLNELGLDSLMSVNLTNRLEHVFNVSVPVADLIEGPSIRELSAQLQALTGRPAAALSVTEVSLPRSDRAGRETSNPWLVYPRRNPDADCRLVCFPFAGGGATVYRPWGELIGDHIELVAIEPPGRSGRVREPSIRSLDVYISELTSAVSTLTDKPLAFFGHCLGGLNMFETVQRLLGTGACEPLHVFASGSRPPHDVTAVGEFEQRLFSSLLRMRDFDPWKPLHEQPEDVFRFIIRQFDIGATSDFLEHEKLAEALVPAVRADFEITQGYSPTPSAPWQCPITCFIGRDDPYVSREQALAWSRYTAADFRVLFRDAAHFIVSDDRAFIVDTINKSLAAATSRPQ